MNRRLLLQLLPSLAVPVDPAVGQLPVATFNGIPFPPPMRIVRAAAITRSVESRVLLEALERMGHGSVMVLPSGSEIEIIQPKEFS